MSYLLNQSNSYINSSFVAEFFRFSNVIDVTLSAIFLRAPASPMVVVAYDLIPMSISDL